MKRFFTVLLFASLCLYAGGLRPLQAHPHHLCYIDGLFEGQMRNQSIAGASFALWMGDTLEATRSYGYRDLAKGLRVDAQTGFGIGSVSKLFVWVAVMQLYEQGKLALDEPVNTYLQGFRLPESYQAVHMRHLMSHTPGFEDRMHIFTRSTQNLPDIESFLRQNLPRQIYEPGTLPAYSNYGVVLAAYVVEQLSGQSFEDYVRQHIFDPLGMTYSGFEQPLPGRLLENKSKGYLFRDGEYESPFEEYVAAVAAGAAVCSASDMLRFMKMLGGVEQDTAPVLQQESLDLMLSTLYTPDERIPGMAHGFFKMRYKDVEVIWHGGGTYFFTTMFAIIPQYQMGLYFSVNTAGSGFDPFHNLALILDYLLELPGQNGSGISGNYQEYAGSYLPSRSIQSDYLKIINLFQAARVKTHPQGLMLSYMGAKPELYRATASDRFQGTHSELVFVRNGQGKIDQVYLSSMPVFAYLPARQREKGGYNLVVLLVTLLIALRSIFMPLKGLWRSDRKKNQAWRWWMLAWGVLVISFFVLFFTVFNGVEPVIFEKPAGLTITLLIPWFSLLCAGLGVLWWLKEDTCRRQDLHFTLVQFAGFIMLILFYTQMFFWNFLSFSFF